MCDQGQETRRPIRKSNELTRGSNPRGVEEGRECTKSARVVRSRCSQSRGLGRSLGEREPSTSPANCGSAISISSASTSRLSPPICRWSAPSARLRLRHQHRNRLHRHIRRARSSRLPSMIMTASRGPRAPTQRKADARRPPNSRFIASHEPPNGAVGPSVSMMLEEANLAGSFIMARTERHAGVGFWSIGHRAISTQTGRGQLLKYLKRFASKRRQRPLWRLLTHRRCPAHAPQDLGGILAGFNTQHPFARSNRMKAEICGQSIG